MIFSAVVVEFSFEPLVALLRKADQLFSVRRAMLTSLPGKTTGATTTAQSVHAPLSFQIRHQRLAKQKKSKADHLRWV